MNSESKQPTMLAIQASSKPPHLQPNLLPCRIQHDGPIKISKRYWSPASSTASASDKTAYFRGRKLRGRVVRLPAGYQGVVLKKTERCLPPSSARARRTTPEAIRSEEVEQGESGGDGGGEEQEEGDRVRVMETEAVFDSLTFWGHEALPGDEDPYVKGLNEWIAFAEAMHSYPGSSHMRSKTTEAKTAAAG